jgi:CHAT domain-containing protein/Flp pilus assembly protein TadD
VKRLVLVAVLIAAACERAPSLETLEATGMRQLQAGDLDAAAATAKQGRERSAAVRDPGWDRRFRALLGEILVEQRKNQEALLLLGGDSVPPGAGDPIAIRILTARGHARCLIADSPATIRTGETEVEQAAAGAAALNDPELAAEAALHLGNCAMARRDFPGAEARFRQALTLAQQHQVTLAEAKATGSLGWVRVRLRRFDEALLWLNKALVMATELKSNLMAVKTLTNLGWCQYSLGDYPQALTFFSKAESLAEARGYLAERRNALQMVGNIQYQQRDLDKAASAYRRALELASDLGDRGAMAQLYGNLGEIQRLQERYDEAEASLARSLQITTAMEDTDGLQHLQVEQGNLADARGDYPRADALYAQILSTPNLDPELQWESRAGLAVVRTKMKRFVEADQEYRKAFDVIEQSTGELRRADHKISFFSSLYRFYYGYVDFLVSRDERARALDVAERSRARLLREAEGGETSARQTKPQDVRQVARALNATILFYWLAPGRSFLWTITPAEVSLHELPGADVIRGHVEAHQALVLKSRDPLKEASPDAMWLHHTLIEPAGSAVASGSRVVFIPDGALNQVNPETLIVPGPSPHYWIEDVTLLMAPSLPVLPAGNERARRPAVQPSILLVGDPVASGEEFPRLPHAAKEIGGIGEQFPESQRTVRTGADASPRAYLTSTPAQFSFVHFAAHAEANADVPLDSAVILSASGDTSKLYARDIQNVPLRAELVTISGCRSAGSRTYSGEGLVGLAWAFMRAGAHRVIAGLWNVEDASTSELMESLYRGLTRGEAPEEALRHAKLQLIQSDSAYRKPFYWAPFMMYTRTAQPPAKTALTTTH